MPREVGAVGSREKGGGAGVGVKPGSSPRELWCRKRGVAGRCSCRVMSVYFKRRLYLICRSWN